MLDLPQPYSLNLFSLKYFPNTQIAQMAVDAGIIDKSELDDNQIEDKDSYLISKSAVSQDDMFINRLALYISNNAGIEFSNEFKSIIYKLIGDYKIYKNIGTVQAASVLVLDVSLNCLTLRKQE